MAEYSGTTSVLRAFWKKIKEFLTTNYYTKEEADPKFLTPQQAFDIAHPVGEVYVQYPSQLDPNYLYHREPFSVKGKWELLNYDGCFFRAQGTGASAFSSGVQAEELPNVKGTVEKVHFNTTQGKSGALGYGDQVDNWGKTGGGSTFCSVRSINLNLSSGNSIYKDNGHVVPKNMTVRIWVRTE